MEAGSKSPTRGRSVWKERYIPSPAAAAANCCQSYVPLSSITAAWCGCWSACLKSASNSMRLYTNLTDRTRMRNGHKPAVRGIRGISGISVLMLALGLMAVTAGCGGRGANAARARKTSSAAAAGAATPSTPASAQLILEALEQLPRQPLESYIHASLGNVAYFQDDYQSAIGQLNAAYDKLDSDDIKAWALYRVGLSQQRLGQFAQADQTFTSVQQFHPNSVPAQRAREHQGARAFYVQ